MTGMQASAGRATEQEPASFPKASDVLGPYRSSQESTRTKEKDETSSRLLWRHVCTMCFSQKGRDTLTQIRAHTFPKITNMAASKSSLGGLTC